MTSQHIEETDVSQNEQVQLVLCVGGFATTGDASGEAASGLGLYSYGADGIALIKHLDLDQPTWFVWSEKHRMLYVSHSARTWLSAVSIPGGIETAEIVDTIDIDCVNPAHIALDSTEQGVVAACFTGGEVIGVALDQHGRFDGVRSRIPTAGLVSGALRRHVFQSDAEPHQSVFVTDGTQCLVPDRAQDAVHVFDYEGGGVLAYETSLTLRPGSGPRHLAQHPHEPIVYIACELDSTLVTAKWRAGALEPMRLTSTLPDDFFGESAVAAIAVSPDAKRLIVSNRGYESVAVFDIERDPERPRLVGWIPVRGETVRFAGFLPAVARFAVAAMGSDVVYLFGDDARALDAATRGAEPESAVPHVAPACVRALALSVKGGA